jgi:hypothetical protein
VNRETFSQLTHNKEKPYEKHTTHHSVESRR